MLLCVFRFIAILLQTGLLHCCMWTVKIEFKKKYYTMFKVDLNSHIGTSKRAFWCKCAGKYSGIQIGEQRFRTAPSSVWVMDFRLHRIFLCRRLSVGRLKKSLLNCSRKENNAIINHCMKCICKQITTSGLNWVKRLIGTKLTKV